MRMKWKRLDTDLWAAWRNGDRIVIRRTDTSNRYYWVLYEDIEHLKDGVTSDLKVAMQNAEYSYARMRRTHNYSNR